MYKKYLTTHAAELESLEKFREFVAAACRENGVGDEINWALQLSVDEAAANVIQHGYAGNPGSLSLEVRVYPDRMNLRLTDFGHPFEPGSAPVPDVNAPLELREPGGFGLFFIYSIMDEVDYQATEDGNVLSLTKRLQS